MYEDSSKSLSKSKESQYKKNKRVDAMSKDKVLINRRRKSKDNNSSKSRTNSLNDAHDIIKSSKNNNSNKELDEEDDLENEKDIMKLAGKINNLLSKEGINIQNESELYDDKIYLDLTNAIIKEEINLRPKDTPNEKIKNIKDILFFLSSILDLELSHIDPVDIIENKDKDSVKCLLIFFIELIELLKSQEDITTSPSEEIEYLKVSQTYMEDSTFIQKNLLEQNSHNKRSKSTNIKNDILYNNNMRKSNSNNINNNINDSNAINNNNNSNNSNCKDSSMFNFNQSGSNISGAQKQLLNRQNNQNKKNGPFDITFGKASKDAKNINELIHSNSQNKDKNKDSISEEINNNINNKICKIISKNNSNNKEKSANCLNVAKIENEDSNLAKNNKELLQFDRIIRPLTENDLKLIIINLMKKMYDEDEYNKITKRLNFHKQLMIIINKIINSYLSLNKELPLHKEFIIYNLKRIKLLIKNTLKNRPTNCNSNLPMKIANAIINDKSLIQNLINIEYECAKEKDENDKLAYENMKRESEKQLLFIKQLYINNYEMEFEKMNEEINCQNEINNLKEEKVLLEDKNENDLFYRNKDYFEQIEKYEKFKREKRKRITNLKIEV